MVDVAVRVSVEPHEKTRVRVNAIVPGGAGHEPSYMTPNG
jgi:hypothetical protein